MSLSTSAFIFESDSFSFKYLSLALSNSTVSISFFEVFFCKRLFFFFNISSKGRIILFKSLILAEAKSNSNSFNSFVSFSCLLNLFNCKSNAFTCISISTIISSILSKSLEFKSNFFIVDLLLALYLFTPAASSNICLLLSSLSDNICSIIFNSITEYASEVNPVSTKRLEISFNLQLFLLMKYLLSPDLYNLLPISTSEYSTGNNPLLFSIVK